MIPFDYPDLFDTLILGTTISPGKVTLSGHDRNLDWDVQAPKGSSGATSKLNGSPIGQFQATFQLDADGTEEGPNDFELWERFRRVVESLTSGPTPIALPIYHPDLAANGYTEVSSAMIGAPVYDDRGGAQVTVKFIEYRPPKPKPVKSAGAKSSSPTADEAGEQRPDPNAAAKRELDALVSEARAP